MRLQDRFKTLFADSCVPYYLKEKNGKYIDINEAFLLDYKKKSPNEIIGQKDIDLWEGKAPLFHINDQKVILSNKSSVYIENILFENEKRFYMSCKAPLYSSLGRVIGIFGVSFSLNSNQALFSSALPEELIESIQLLQYSYFKNDFPQESAKLTNRQKECLHFFVKGMTIKEIAITLHLSPKTIENYLRTVKIKLNCTNRYQLVEKAIELGIV